MIRTLLRHRWKRLVRGASAGRRWVEALVALLLGGYFVLAAVLSGALFPAFVEAALPGAAPLALLNAWMPAGLLGLVGGRFFFQSSSQGALRPYLHLPVSRRRLAHTAQVLSGPGLITGITLFFLVPVCLSTVRPAATSGGAWLWLLGALALLLATHYVVLPLRVAAERFGRRFWLVVAGAVALLVLDAAVGPGLGQRASGALFGALAGGRVAVLAVPVAVLAAAYAGSVRALLYALGNPDAVGRSRRGTRRAGQRWLTRRTHAGRPVAALAAVEAKLILRNGRARSQLILAPLFGIGYTLLVTGGADPSRFELGFAGVLSSGAFALFYGQFLFSWDSAHLSGLLARVPDARTLLDAKLRFLQGTCAVLWLLGLPLFVWLRPALLPSHTVFLLFNAGVMCPLLVALGLFATKPIDLSKGSFMNYQGTSWIQFAQMILVIAPAVLLMLLPAPWHLWSTAVLGAAGTLATPWWTRALLPLFDRRRHRMLAGFRAS